MSPEIRLIVSPGATYAALVRSPAPIAALRALRRPLLGAVILGVAMALAATRHVTPALVLSTTLLWGTLIVGQVAIALVVIAGPSRATLGPARALDLFFASHGPWSLWLLAAAAWAPTALGRPFAPLWLAALAPIVLTPRIIAAFFREALGMDRRRAIRRTVAHQMLTWGLLLAGFGVAVAAWPRVLQVLR